MKDTHRKKRSNGLTLELEHGEQHALDRHSGSRHLPSTEYVSTFELRIPYHRYGSMGYGESFEPPNKDAPPYHISIVTGAVNLGWYHTGEGGSFPQTHWCPSP
jgi:hypothetical protein